MDVTLLAVGCLLPRAASAHAQSVSWFQAGAAHAFTSEPNTGPRLGFTVFRMSGKVWWGLDAAYLWLGTQAHLPTYTDRASDWFIGPAVVTRLPRTTSLLTVGLDVAAVQRARTYPPSISSGHPTAETIQVNRYSIAPHLAVSAPLLRTGAMGIRLIARTDVPITIATSTSGSSASPAPSGAAGHLIVSVAAALEWHPTSRARPN